MLRKRRQGQSIIEMIVGVIVLIPICLVLFDLAVIVLGVQLNDATCRDAARAAASGDPSNATARATAIVSRANARSHGQIVANFAMVGGANVNIVSQPTPHQEQTTGLWVNPGGPITGTATVTTKCEVRPFVVYMVYTGQTPLIFQSRQTFPISYVVPSTGASSTAGN